MKRVRIFFYLFVLFFLSKSVLYAQDSTLVEISGTIKDDITREPLIGAVITYLQGKGATADIDGKYSFKIPSGDYTLNVSYIGYEVQEKKIKVSEKKQIIDFRLSGNVSLSEVEIVADIAKIRETPVAVSTIYAQQISQEIGASDLPLILNSTPGVYATQQGGGAGDARVNIRGFDQRYVAVLVDGVPVNDMENGQVYWSNWSGLSEVTKQMQVQRGLGASRLALPSVGGTMNIITSSIDEKRFFVVKNDLGTNNYGRFSLGYNSGILKDKFGITLAGSYTTGNGWADQTFEKVWSYFGKFRWRINTKSSLILGVNGAPQSHGQRSTQINMAYYDRNFAVQQGVNADSIYSSATNSYTDSSIGDRGLHYNPNWGYVNGKAVNIKVNYFHKPLFNLSCFLQINDKLNFSNVLYVSIGRGGGTGMFNPPSYNKDYDGQLLLQNTYDVNSTAIPNGLIPGLRPTSSFIYSSVNNHNWAGTLSTIKWKIKNTFDFTGGLDARYYNGIHYQTPYDLLGADYTQQPLGKDKNLAPITKDPDSYVKKVGDKINYNYQSKVTWLGAFTQLEYKAEKFSAFATFTGSQSSMQNINYFGRKDVVLSKNNIAHNAISYGDTLYYDGKNYGATTNPYGIPNANGITHNTDGTITFKDNITKQYVTLNPDYKTYNINSSEARINTTEIKYYYGYTLKSGINYKLNAQQNIFTNIGYMNLAPKYNNVFDRSGTELKNIRNQLIESAEIGYGFRNKYFASNINGYLTSWLNKPLDFALTYTDPQTGNLYYYNIPGIDASLMGIELDFTVNINRFIKVSSFGMLSDWRWASGSTAYIFTDDGSLLDSVVFDATKVHIGNSPQRQIGGNIRFEPVQGFYIKPQIVFFGNMYAQFDPSNLKVSGAKDYRKYDSWKMPEYYLLDLFFGYSIKKTNSTEVSITCAINNVMNSVYLTDASFAPATTPNQYSATNMQGYMGLGRRMTMGIKIIF
ncbi:MAG: TonB-dependent receptor [Bacteroidetes bacterium]|nr:TonB-dependent receptor [Bacteroidota bacterium]